jgi:protein SCO1/2
VPGKDYEYVAVSFDPKETAALASTKKQNYQEKYNFPRNAEGIHFLTADENSVKILADAIGFKYKWVEQAKEWAHASAAVLLTPDGTIARYLHGVYFEPKTMRLSLVEASKGSIGDLKDSVLLFCVHYEPTEGAYAPLMAFNAMRVACVIILSLVLFWLISYWLKQRRKTV